MFERRKGRRLGCLKRGKFLGGGWVIKDPIGMEIPEWCSDANQNVFHGEGAGGSMDIFWDRTIQTRNLKGSSLAGHQLLNL